MKARFTDEQIIQMITEQEAGERTAGFFFRYERHFVYWKELGNGDIGIVAVLHKRMHQISRIHEDFEF